MTTKHTPTPWTIESRTHNGCGYTIQSPSSHYSRCNVASYVSKSDAEFITHACNNHKPPFEALELLIDTITPEAWEALPQYVQEKVMEVFNMAKAGAHNV